MTELKEHVMLLLVVVASTFGFQIYEIETEFLHAD